MNVSAIYEKRYIPRKLANRVTTKKRTSWASKECCYSDILWIDEDLSQFIHDQIEAYEFKPLNEVKRALRSSGGYKSYEVDKLIKGLSRLPGYESQTNSSDRGHSRSKK